MTDEQLLVEAEALIAEWDLRVEDPNKVAWLLGDVRLRKAKDNGAVSIFHGLKDKYQKDQLVVVEAVICKAFAIDHHHKDYRPLHRMSAAQAESLYGTAETGEENIEVMLEGLDEFSQEPVTWTWDGRVPRGGITLIAGEPECLKTGVVLSLISHSTTGRRMPDGGSVDSGMWLYCTSENDKRRNLKPRVVAEGGDVHLVKLFRTREVTGKKTKERQFDLSRDIEALERAIDCAASTETPVVGIVLDPGNQYLGDNVNTWRDSDVFNVLGPLEELAERNQISVVFVMHPAKGEGTTVLNKILGSKAFTMKSRAVWFCSRESEPHQGQPERFLFSNEKMSSGPRALSLQYELGVKPAKAADGDDTARVALITGVPIVNWLPGSTTTRVKDIADAAKQDPMSEAMVVILRELLDGTKSGAHLNRVREDKGVARPTFERARTKLKEHEIITQVGGGRDATWQLARGGPEGF